MSQLNLLPWRDLRRQEVDRQVRNIAIAAAIAMAGLVYFGYYYMNTRIDFQKERNDYITSEIKKLDHKLKEIKDIQKRRAALIARMEVIQKLQADRTRMVKNFDGLARSLPDGMYLTLFSIKGKNIQIKGTADSNGTISKFMRKVESSNEFTTPDLNIIQLKDKGGVRTSNFILKFKLKPQTKKNASSSKKNTETVGKQ